MRFLYSVYKNQHLIRLSFSYFVLYILYLEQNIYFKYHR